MARDLVVRIIGDSSSLERSLKRSEKATAQFGRTTDRTFRGVVAGSGAFRSLGRSAAFASTSFLGGAGLGFALTSTVNAASDLNEEMSKSVQIFGQSAASVKAWSKTSSEALKISQTDALRFTGAIGAMLKTTGVAGPQLAAMSKRLVQLGADMASFNNEDPSDMLDRLRSGLAGEAEPLRRFGVLLSEARVQQEAYRLGLAKTGAKLTEQQKVLARYSLILKDTVTQQGDVARTGDQFAGQMRELSARIKDLQSQLGSRFLPTLTQALQQFNRLLAIVGPLASVALPALEVAFKAVSLAVTTQLRLFRAILNLYLKGFSALLGAAEAVSKAIGGTFGRALGAVGIHLGGATSAIDSAKSAVDGLRDSINNLGKTSKTLIGVASAIQNVGNAIAQAGAQGGGGAPSAAGGGGGGSFQLPGPLRLAQAQANVTAAIADDVAVAKRIKAFIEARIAAGSLKGQRLIDALGDLAAAEGVIRSAMDEEASKRKDAAQKEADARKKHADALKEQARRFADAVDRVRSQIGELFSPLPENVLRAQRRAALGLPGPDPLELVRNERARTQAFLQNQRNINRLARAGAPTRLIAELRGQGLENAPQIAALAGANRRVQRQFFQAFRQREDAARKAAERPINLNVQVFLDDRNITGKVVVKAQRQARHQGKQRRGRHGGAALGLA